MDYVNPFESIRLNVVGFRPFGRLAEAKDELLKMAGEGFLS